MAYVKLDVGILNSTLWVDRECREVFITALLMAVPRELPEPQPQISVRSLDLTGFVAPPGRYGFVEAAGVGILRVAMVPLEPGLAALERLGSTDDESRSPAFGGRRLIRVAGGYLVLNFDEYRTKDHTAAERARRYRQRQSSAQESSHRDATPSRRNVTPERDGHAMSSRYVTQAEAEAELIQSNLSTGCSSSAVPAKDPAIPDCPHKRVLELWAEVLPQMPQHRPSLWNGTRAQHLRARWRETAAEKGWKTEDDGLAYLRKLFTYVGASRFLSGKVQPRNGHAAFQAELAWLVSPANWAKVHEGKYHQEQA